MTVQHPARGTVHVWVQVQVNHDPAEPVVAVVALSATLLAAKERDVAIFCPWVQQLGKFASGNLVLGNPVCVEKVVDEMVQDLLDEFGWKLPLELWRQLRGGRHCKRVCM